MWFSSLTLLSALIISGVAAFYSIMGLTAIFAAAFWPIVIMATALEVGKIVSALWLHKYWKRCKIAFKLYLMPAVVILMLITSMGIFGFLSKAHLQQTARGDESTAQILRITSELARQQNIIARAEQQINKLETTGSGSNAQVQLQIDREQKRIDSAYARIQPAINEQNKIIAAQGGIYKTELDKIDNELDKLQKYIDAGEVKKAQAMVGASADGKFGRRTAEKFRSWQTEKQAERAVILKKIEQSSNNPRAKAAATEIKRIRHNVEIEIAESNKLINKLRTSLGDTTNVTDIQKLIDEQNSRIKSSNADIETLTKQKYDLQAQYRKLEAEVGPIRYVAALIYGDNPDQNLLERAVRWVIMALVFVFDPLAVVLILAAAQSFAWIREDDPEKKTLTKVKTQYFSKPNPDPDQITELENILKKTIEEKDLLQNDLNELATVLEKMIEEKQDITGYQERISELSERLKTVETEKDDLSKEIDGLNMQLFNQKSLNDSMKLSYTDLGAQITRLQEEKKEREEHTEGKTEVFGTTSEPPIDAEELETLIKRLSNKKLRASQLTDYQQKRILSHLRKDQVLGK